LLAHPIAQRAVARGQPNPVSDGVADDLYEGHSRTRWTVSGEHQGKLAAMFGVVHPAMNWS